MSLLSRPSYYSMRQLSPYGGLVQVVDISGFRALSTDGHCWRVQLNQTGARYAMHGVWYRDNASSFISTAQTEPYIQAMESMPELPFPMADSLELWLLDKQSLPLALVSSRLAGSPPPRLENVNWIATYSNENTFHAPSLSGVLANEGGANLPYPHSEVLHRCVRARAGALARAQWFQRSSDGSGHGYNGCRIDKILEGRYLDKGLFPELLLTEDGWETDQEARLVRDYHNWQAANLLTHTNVSVGTRDRLERHACRQAEMLYTVRDLLPERINKELLEAAFVQAIIMRSSGSNIPG